MADAFSWVDMGRWLFSLRRVLPDRVLRWVWSQDQFLAQVRVFTAAEPPPHLFVRVDRENPELTHLAFHVVNLTPFKLGIVAASGTVTLDSRELFAHEQRFATEMPLPSFATATFGIRHALTEAQAQRLRSYPRQLRKNHDTRGHHPANTVWRVQKRPLMRSGCAYRPVARRSISDAQPFIAPDVRQAAPVARG